MKPLYIESPPKSGKYRKPTDDELQTIKGHLATKNRIEKKIKKYKAELANLEQIARDSEWMANVFYDEDGYIYNVRHFVLVDETDLI